MSVLYGSLAALALFCCLRALAPTSSSESEATERLGAAMIAALTVGVIVGLLA